eukprot:TRINITY_DN26635_c0_g1_i1.p1 TRINITY_DN26635_c0_g1~~TRINITY_DN26635_c0_g1_i1.p1  ORF type:complete len:225 (+),score=29.24 TRINITY_DN26635_c0_g1_i1:67-741(+)
MVFFFNDTATTEIYTRSIVGSVRCVQETGINAEYMGSTFMKKVGSFFNDDELYRVRAAELQGFVDKISTPGSVPNAATRGNLAISPQNLSEKDTPNSDFYANPFREIEGESTQYDFANAIKEVTRLQAEYLARKLQHHSCDSENGNRGRRIRRQKQHLLSKKGRLTFDFGVHLIDISPRTTESEWRGRKLGSCSVSSSTQHSSQSCEECTCQIIQNSVLQGLLS